MTYVGPVILKFNANYSVVLVKFGFQFPGIYQF